jgi:predicted enzyme related to lactoylglutathione lyase
MSNAEIRGRFVWHELMTTDTDAASDFYSRVVPWKAEDSGMPSYSIWMSGKVRAGGLMALPENDGPATPPHWIIYVGTPDVDATVEAAEKLGGKILKPAADIPNVGRFAVLSDPQGAAFAVFTPSSMPEEGILPSGGVGDFTWHELATTDPDAALNFYTELFGWSKGAAHDMGEMIYHIVTLDGKDVGGVYKARDNTTPPNWLSYVRVADASKAASAVKSAGGRVLNGPMEVPGGSWIVQVLDPQGGSIALVEAAAGATGESGDDADESAAPKKASKKAVKKAAKKAPPAKAAPAKAAPAKAAAGKSAGKTAGKTAGKAAKKAAKKAGKTPGKASSGKASGKTARKAAGKVAKKAAGKSAAKPAAKKAVKKAAKKAVSKASKPKAKAKGKAARKK